MAPLRRRDLLRVFVRSLGLQGSWSFGGMQSLGFAYAIDPALARLHGRGEGRRRALDRHLEFFNTHPFMASAVLGCAVRLEEDGGAGAEEAVRRAKNALMGPCGAMGDSLYWGALKPLLVLVALLAAQRGALWAPLAFVVAFTTLNLAGRAVGFWQGYRRGLGVVEALARWNVLGWAARLKAGCALLLGAVLASAVGAPEAAWGHGVWALRAAGSFVAAVVLAALIAKGVKTEWMVYLAALVSVGLVTL